MVEADVEEVEPGCPRPWTVGGSNPAWSKSVVVSSGETLNPHELRKSLKISLLVINIYTEIKSRPTHHIVPPCCYSNKARESAQSLMIYMSMLPLTSRFSQIHIQFNQHV